MPFFSNKPHALTILIHKRCTCASCNNSAASSLHHWGSCTVVQYIRRTGIYICVYYI